MFSGLPGFVQEYGRLEILSTASIRETNDADRFGMEAPIPQEFFLPGHSLVGQFMFRRTAGVSSTGQLIVRINNVAPDVALGSAGGVTGVGIGWFMAAYINDPTVTSRSGAAFKETMIAGWAVHETSVSTSSGVYTNSAGSPHVIGVYPGIGGTDGQCALLSGYIALVRPRFGQSNRPAIPAFTVPQGVL